MRDRLAAEHAADALDDDWFDWDRLIETYEPDERFDYGPQFGEGDDA